MGNRVKKMKPGKLTGPSHKKGGIAANVGNQPIEMEGGEFVINKKMAKKLGDDTLHYMNKHGELPNFADGGMIPEYAWGGKMMKSFGGMMKKAGIKKKKGY